MRNTAFKAKNVLYFCFRIRKNGKLLSEKGKHHFKTNTRTEMSDSRLDNLSKSSAQNYNYTASLWSFIFSVLQEYYMLPSQHSSPPTFTCIRPVLRQSCLTSCQSRLSCILSCILTVLHTSCSACLSCPFLLPSCPVYVLFCICPILRIRPVLDLLASVLSCRK